MKEIILFVLDLGLKFLSKINIFVANLSSHINLIDCGVSIIGSYQTFIYL